MCGIAGVACAEEQELDDLVKDMLASMKHRGPDGSGTYYSPFCAIGANRLAIVDLANGNQPLLTEDKTLAIVFNGEIYNYQELRSQLIRCGCKFHTECDTEVILHLYKTFGTEGFSLLQGMFAFAIASNKEILLVRDPIGIKPLYISTDLAGRFVFSSEIKGLLKNPNLLIKLCETYLADVMILGYSASHLTPFEGIQCLPPGTWMRIKISSNGISKETNKYYGSQVSSESHVNFSEAGDKFLELIRQSVSKHLTSDWPITVALSGGIDSSFLTVLVSDQLSYPPKAITVASYQDHPDLLCSREIASSLGIEITEKHVDIKSFTSQIPQAVWCSEDIANLYAIGFLDLFKAASKFSKVIICGEGADELFGGYPIYQENYLSSIQHFINKLSTAKASGLTPSADTLNTVESLLTSSSQEEYLQTLFQINMTHQLVRNHLDVLDKHTMAFSVEGRVPFLDRNIVNFISGLPVNFKVAPNFGISKLLLKCVSMANYPYLLHKPALRQKFGMPDSTGSILHKLSEICDQIVPEQAIKKEISIPGWNKLDYILFSIHKLIFYDHRGSLDTGLVFSDLLAEFSGIKTSKVNDILHSS